MNTGYESRALAAYYREMTKMERQGMSMKEPSAANTTVEQYNGRQYVVLSNTYDTLAVYRVGNNGLLRRLRRWPKAVNAFPSEGGA